MIEHSTDNDWQDPDEIDLEVILQRIFHEDDPVAHRAAIWELLHLTDDWDTFEQIAEFGGERGIENYFQNTLDQIHEPNPLDENVSDLPFMPIEHQDSMRELYTNPLHSLRGQDWAGSAAAMHEILLFEIYDVYQIDDSELPIEEATSSGLEKAVGEEVLFPLSVIEYLAYSDQLTRSLAPAILNNYLAFMLTLFFSAQAHLDIEESRRSPGIEPGGEEWSD